MRLTFHPRGWEDDQHGIDTDRAMLCEVNALIRERLRHPFGGTGKPEPLWGDLAGFWSRRIDREHRLVHLVTADAIEVAQ